MKKIGTIIFCIALLTLGGCSRSTLQTGVNTFVNQKMIIEDLNAYFTGYEGCFILFDKNKNDYTVYNQRKSLEQVSPCSTFKVMNALIGLEVNVLEDENTTFKWDATTYYNPQWNKDQTLQEAITNSTFWYFQRNATKIGSEKMKASLKKIGYGNMDISGGITQFWQQSTLKISPKEQIEVLKRMYSYELPFSKESIDIVKKILVLSNDNGIILSGKTGSGLKSGQFIPQGTDDPYIIGWFIGYVEKDNNVYFFAANVQAEKDAVGMVAKNIVLKILKDKQIL